MTYNPSQARIVWLRARDRANLELAAARLLAWLYQEGSVPPRPTPPWSPRDTARLFAHLLEHNRDHAVTPEEWDTLLRQGWGQSEEYAHGAARMARPARPTRALPGSLAKLRVLQRRAAAGQPLHHERDAALTDDAYARLGLLAGLTHSRAPLIRGYAEQGSDGKLSLVEIRTAAETREDLDRADPAALLRDGYGTRKGARLLTEREPVRHKLHAPR